MQRMFGCAAMVRFTRALRVLCTLLLHLRVCQLNMGYTQGTPRPLLDCGVEELVGLGAKLV